MAELVSKILGTARGKIGDVVFKRFKNGKVFFSTHKGSNVISKSKKCVDNRTRFNNAVKFAKAVNSLPELRKIWKSSAIEGRSAYTKIMSYNIKLFHETNPAKTNKICPPGFGFHADNIKINNNSVSVDIMLGSDNSNLINKIFTANFVVALFDRKPDKEEYTFPYAIASTVYISANESEYQNVTAYFDSFQKENVEAFTRAIVFFTFTNTESKRFIHSGSLARETYIIQL